MILKRHVDYSAVFPAESPQYMVRIGEDGIVTLINHVRSTNPQVWSGIPSELIEFATRVVLKAQDLNKQNCYIKR